MKYGFVIPIYRHGKTACLLAEKLSAFALPVIMVDDGNDEETKALLAECSVKVPETVLVSLEKNTGKGGAVTGGLEKAAELGLSHVFQIDADGQHDTGRIAFFLEESAKNPGKVICGRPEFDGSVPKSRISGRKISNFWAAVTTLSKELSDVLCGFRVYPVKEALKIARNPFVDKRMGFDPEILVRLYWKKVFPVYHPVKTSYPENGISNFHAVSDNVRISLMFTRLSVGMLIRLPLLLIMRTKRRKLTSPQYK